MAAALYSQQVRRASYREGTVGEQETVCFRRVTVCAAALPTDISPTSGGSGSSYLQTFELCAGRAELYPSRH